MGELRVSDVESNAISFEASPSFCDESWRRSEVAVDGIIRRIHPTVVSEQRRMAVVDYAQRLIGEHLGREVFPFGSVPLKTYLPDGDIDLTALILPNMEDVFANEVRSLLEREEHNKDAEFKVKDIQIIHAEVKLVKCIVQNIVVDISFNQLGGLCTLCFLERVDFMLGREHLFKRSIILIKAWCYYESRILGAHHGLISTYALETLVLYIFQLFHSSLYDPLAVLYKFLDHFSKFDWDNYGISLNGPICVASLPEIIATPPENDGGELLLSKDCLHSYMEIFTVPLKASENSRTFPRKYLNIVDPLRENNNLGRSVSKGNFYRIRSAFGYGARKLGRILLMPEEKLGTELNKFFANTLDRHGSGHRPDVHGHIPTACDILPNFNGYIPLTSNVEFEICLEDRKSTESSSGNSSSTVGDPTTDSNRILSEMFNEVKLLDSDQTHSTRTLKGKSSSEKCFNGTKESGSTNLASDGKNLSETTKEVKYSSSMKHESGVCSHSCLHDKQGRNLNQNDEESISSNPSDLELEANPTMEYQSNQFKSYSDPVCPTSTSLNTHSTDASTLHCQEKPNTFCFPTLDEGNCEVVNSIVNPEAWNTLSDLGGEYEIHLNNMNYAQQFYLSFCYGPAHHPPSIPEFPNKHFPTSFHHIANTKGNVYVSMNGIIPRPPLYSPPGYFPLNPHAVSGIFNMQDMPKPRGTGTYFPNMNHLSYRERDVSGRGRSQISDPPMHRSRHNIRVGTSTAATSDKCIHEPPQNGHGKSGPVGFFPSNHSATKSINPSNNGLVSTHEGLKFGSLEPLPLIPNSGLNKPLDFNAQNLCSQTFLPGSRIQKLRMSPDEERVSQSYFLKDEDFPPLSL